MIFRYISNMSMEIGMSSIAAVRLKIDGHLRTAKDKSRSLHCCIKHKACPFEIYANCKSSEQTALMRRLIRALLFSSFF